MVDFQRNLSENEQHSNKMKKLFRAMVNPNKTDNCQKTFLFILGQSRCEKRLTV